MSDFRDRLERLRELAPAQPEPMAEIERRAGRYRMRRRATFAVSSLAVVAVLVVVGSLVAGPNPDRGPVIEEPRELAQPGGWSEIPQPPGPPRASTLAVWTGQELVMIGGMQPDGSGLVGGGIAFDPRTGAWREIASPPIDETARLWDRWADAYWTGEEVLVYPRYEQLTSPRDHHGEYVPPLAYDPSADSWRGLAPEPWDLATTWFAGSAWTSDELLVIVTPEVGGSPVGAAYDPATDQWRMTADFPIDEHRVRPSLVWAGDELLVWGGWGRPAQIVDVPFTGEEEGETLRPPRHGAAYDPANDAWRVLDDVADEVHDIHPVAWTGDRLLALRSGQLVAVSPDLRTVRRLAASPARIGEFHPPTYRGLVYPTAWTGTELVVVGDYRPVGSPRQIGGAAYDPVQDAWRLLPDPGLSSDAGHTVVWTGNELLVVGGHAILPREQSEAARDAYVYNPPGEWQGSSP